MNATVNQENIESYVDITKYTLSLLNTRQLPLVLPDFHNEDWFTTLYQSRAQKKDPELYSLRTLLQAVHNSESEFKQYSVDEQNLKELSRSIFADALWLMKDPVLAVVDGVYYIIGGRHRITAIANVFAQWVREQFASFAEYGRIQDAFERCLRQNIRVEVLYLHSMSDLLLLIQSDNESRIMRKAEHSHLLAQAYGADADTVTSVGKAILGNDISPTEATMMAAQSFVRRPSKLKPQTRQVIGEKVAKYVLYGTPVEKKLSTKNTLKVKSVSEFEDKMDKSWNILNDIIEGKEVVARDSSNIAKQVVEQLEQQIVSSNK